jgi:hypothetical protein
MSRRSSASKKPKVDAVAERHRHVVVAGHRVVRRRQITVVAAACLGAIELTLTGSIPETLLVMMGILFVHGNQSHVRMKLVSTQ